MTGRQAGLCSYDCPTEVERMFSSSSACQCDSHCKVHMHLMPMRLDSFSWQYLSCTSVLCCLPLPCDGTKGKVVVYSFWPWICTVNPLQESQGRDCLAFHRYIHSISYQLPGKPLPPNIKARSTKRIGDIVGLLQKCANLVDLHSSHVE